MDGFESMLSKIVNGSVVTEGGFAVGGSIEPDPQLTAAIEESMLPTSVLIQTLEADTHSGILMALEEFELAQIIGSAQVITEGSGAVGASVVMEGILRRFWDALIEKIKAIGRWLKGIWNKIFKKSDDKAASPAIKEAIDHIEGRSPEAKKLGSLDKQLDKIRADAKKGVEAAVNICGEGFTFIEYQAITGKMGDIETGLQVLTDGLSGSVDRVINTACDRNLNTKSGEESKSGNNKYLTGLDKLYEKALKDDSKGQYGLIGQKTLGVYTETTAHMMKVIDDVAKVNDPSSVKKSETLPKASEFEPVFQVIENGKMKAGINATISKVTNTLNALAKRCEDTKNQLDSGKAYDTKANGVLTKLVSIINATSSASTQMLNRIWSLVYNAAGRYAGIVNRAMKYGKKETTTESTDWQMYMESGDVKEDVPEDDDATGDDGKATTEGYFGGYVGGGKSPLNAYLNSFV